MRRARLAAARRGRHSSVIVRALARGIVAVALVVVAALAGACGDRRDDGTAPAPAGELPPLTFTDDTPTLMLTWIDARGATHVEITPRDVPPEGRRLVRVLLADREAGTRDPIYVANLEQRGEGGAYEARASARSAWEREIEQRRGAWLAEAAPPAPPAAVVPGPPGVAAPGAPPPAPGQPPRGAPDSALPAGVVVVIYGASWCKPCHDAADWLKARGVPTIVKDIEASPDAHAEMARKLQKAGRRGSSIPVIDVAGQILVGFSAPALEKALESASGGTML
jgi:glutaredoxin